MRLMQPRVGETIKKCYNENILQINLTIQNKKRNIIYNKKNKTLSSHTILVKVNLICVVNNS